MYQQKPFNLKILKQDVDKYIEADEDYQKIKQKVDYLNTIVDFLDKTIRQITNRGFLIKDAIEWRKFTSEYLIMQPEKLYCDRVPIR